MAETTALRPFTPVYERVVLWHVALYIVIATWMFGGRIYWATLPLSIWGSLGGLLTIQLLRRNRERRRQYFWWLAPFLLLNLVVGLSLFNPSFSEFIYYGQNSLRPLAHNTVLPSTASATKSLSDIWLYDGLFISAFNLHLGVRRRRTLRILALVAVLNCGVLAVFGTVQSLIKSDIFFGLEHSPNPSFFATFIYHNHWGAYALIVSCLGLGLVAHHLTDRRQRDFWHSPVMALAVPVLLVAISIPLSSSRSTSIAELILLLIATGYLVRFAHRRFRHQRMARFGATLSLVLAVSITIGTAYYLAKPIIERRVQETSQQLRKEKHYAFVGSHRLFYAEARFLLYADTIQMVKANPVWGWGFGCYEIVFPRYNSQSSPASPRPTIYADAHSDWLEALAEIGVVGTLLLLGMSAGAIFQVARHIFRRAFSGFAFLGCVLLALYAMVEFPFANPAVVLSFWTTLFLSTRYAALDRANAPEIVPTSRALHLV